MPIPLLLIGVATASGVVGLNKGREAALNNSEAKELMEDAQRIFEEKKSELYKQRELTTEHLLEYGELKIRIWDEQFSRFVRIFDRVKNVEIEGKVNVDDELSSTLTQDELFEMRQLSLTAGEIVSGGITSLGAGALAGVASYGGAMMFASASTGTAIASLSGAAATSATLAWFGGGSLASGGLGIAGGRLVLGGLVAGPILAVGGLLLASKAKANLAEAKEKHKEAEAAVEKLSHAITMLKGIQLLTYQYYSFAKGLEKAMVYSLDELERIIEYRSKEGRVNNMSNIDYSELHEEEKRILHFITILVQLTKVVLEKPLLEEEGNIKKTSKKYIEKVDFKTVFEGV
jgi:hypothetical protein